MVSQCIHIVRKLMVSQCIHIEYKSKNSWYHSVFTLNTKVELKTHGKEWLKSTFGFFCGDENPFCFTLLECHRLSEALQSRTDG
ncbi:hypothetical protein OUZ56_032798 [Daphnia magna]|uniref:Uncharacterized protein n=1 Tax=Daphnia magna TaxID=35525 RepID=A0ABQ9ZX53_9CRUS|nr:hypothetical protein OUZ56_032798 [Daphnia magna]